MNFFFFSPELIFLMGLAFCSGLSATYLGVGGSVLILPLLPVLTGLDSLQSLQVSLAVIWSASLVNCLAFYFQKLILWPWVLKALPGALFFSFFAGTFVVHLSDFFIRFLLWFFLLLILFLPLFLDPSFKFRLYFLKKPAKNIKNKAFYFFSALMGACSGLTGLGGGIILSPFLQESELVPPKNIPAITAWVMLLVSLVALLGQGPTNLFFDSRLAVIVYLSLCLPHFLGLFCGYFFNLKKENKLLRKRILRLLVGIMFIKMSLELF